MQNKHMDLIISHASREILIMRDLLIRHLRAHLGKVMKCVEVQTPILAANAGGATARPFATQASEFPRRELALRIAPELWLKRLVVGGMDKVFEIGTSFRNEGVDATHNPEFTTCEFYIVNANLSALINITQNIMYGLSKFVEQYRYRTFPDLSVPDVSVFKSGYGIVEFIPTIQDALGQPLPDLESPTALPDLMALLEEKGKTWHHSLPPNPSLPKLLDHIAAAVIEPLSQGKPLFITHHPVCMSPLSRSVKCPITGQQVAQRAELFYNGNEIANMYEEENDPFKQRAKFIAQAEARSKSSNSSGEDPAHVIDEQYLSVLESGLPPTGGWGAGIDRLVMLFSGAKRISDVLPFGNLRHVVGLASVGGGGGASRASAEQTVYSPAAIEARNLVRERRKLAKETAKRMGEHGFLEEVGEDRKGEREMDGKLGEIMYRNKGPNVIE